MKRSVLRIGCAVLSLSAAAGLLASCSLLPPASPLPDSKPAQAEEAPGPVAAPLDDGKLRILYSNGSNGGNTVLYQAASSETVYLVPDTLTGTVRYYLRQWSAPGTPTGRATALCDRSGKEILTFDRAYDAALTGSLLVLTAPEQMAYAPCNNHAAGDCRVIDLATGEELAVPENAYGCSIAGSYLAFEVCNVPADYVPENEWGDDLTAYCAVQVQDRQNNAVRHRIEKLVAVMRTVGNKYGITPAQVALAWAIAKGTTPIIGVTKPSQVQDALQATKVFLTADEMKALEEAAESTGVDTRGSWEMPMV